MSRGPRAKAPRRKRRQRRRGSRSRITIPLGATIGALATVITTSFFVYDRVTGDGCGESRRGTVAAVRADPRATFQDWIDAVGISPKGYTETALATPGAIIRFRGDIWGMENEEIAVHWSLFDARSDLAMARNQSTYERTMTECRDSIKRPIFIPALPGSGPVYAEIVLKHGNDELASDRSENFRQVDVR